MYEKILAQLAAKNPGVSKVILGLVAKKLEAKVTEESQIEGVITEFETNSPVTISEYAELLQKEGDKRVDAALKKAAKPDPEKPTPDPAKPDPANPTDISKQIADAIAEHLKPFAALAGTMKVNQTKEGLKAILKEKKIPEDWADDIHIGEDFNQEEVVARLETKWTNAKQLAINESISDGSVKRGNVAGVTSVTDAIKEYGKNTSAKDAGYNVVENI
jgi:hypothetical protein